jgi:hypothetical protein
VKGVACWTAVLASLWFSSSTLGSGNDLPTSSSKQAEARAKEVVARYLEAIGGADVAKAVVGKRIAYWVHMFGRDAYLMERFWTRPDSMRYGRRGETTYTLTQGQRSWRVSPEGRRELPAVVAGSLSKLADIDGPLIDPADKGVALVYSGVVRYDMTDLHQITATFVDGVQWEFFFDAGTGLLRRTEQPSFRMLNGEFTRGSDVHIYYYDYRPVGRMLYPHFWIQTTEDYTHLFVIEDIQLQE